MAVYSGVVKDNVIVLPDGVQLEEGTEVEVRPVASNGTEPETPEQLFKRKLREAGLVLNFPDPSQRPTRKERRPIKAKGKPLSQTIIEERR